MKTLRVAAPAAVVLLAAALLSPNLAGRARAHCDTLDGPVVASARAALEKGDATPALRWVAKEREGEIRDAFARVSALRRKAPEAAGIADLWFFETLVRIHREGEGAPYTGLKPSGTAPEAGIRDADRALETGDGDALVKALTEAVAEGVKHRLHLAVEARKHADESVEAGREFVEAYVDYVHYVEGLHRAAAGPAHGHGGESGGAGGGHR